MSTFPKSSPQPKQANLSPALGFRIKLTLLLMLVVFGSTILALYITLRTEQAAYQHSLQDKFQSRLGFLLGAQGARETEVAERCRSLAQSVRIQAALEEGDVEDLYANAAIELRDVLDDGNAPLPNQPATAPRATFFRFITPDGKILGPLKSQAAPEPWEEKLVAAGVGPATQQIGYVAIKAASGRIGVHEVVATPILGSDGEKLATLALGFPPSDLAINADTDLKTGIWLDEKLQMPSLPPAIRAALSGAILKFIKDAPESANNFSIQIDDQTYLLFFRILNPGSRFAPAYEICLYSLQDSLARQRRLIWRIGIAALVLVAGMAAAHFFSTHLSRPVEQLAEVSAQNLTGRQQAEAAREITEQKYQSIFENAVEGIFLLAPDGRCLSANPAMARIFGYDFPAQLIAETADKPDRLYVEGRDWNDFMERAIKEGTISGFECAARRRDGGVIWVSQNARSVRDSSGMLLHFEGTMEDITERKKAADSLRTVNDELQKALAELKATQNQIIQQERLRALGQMASGIAHDFNNSLMPVMGFAELLLSSPGILDDKKKTTGYLETIRTAAKDASSIVGRLREFYRSNENSDVFVPVDLSHLARQAVSLTQPKWKGQANAKGVEIQVREELAQVPKISGDESALREVMTNLIFNAVDAMPKGGTITLRTRCENGRAFLEISDTGTGMSEDVRQHCLEPFFTTKGDGGTGLGLAMVFGIVQRHEGTIDLQSRVGEGTTFILGFAVRTESAAALMAKTAQMPSQQALRILLVDDEPQVREVLAAFLENDGHDVRGVDNATEGLRCFGEEKFDLVITDKAIPGMSGDQMALEIKKLSPRTPIVLLSGFNSGAEEERIPGIDVVASKPITMPALRKAIRKAMGTI
jgi:PAS domain S-box-containing protein